MRIGLLSDIHGNLPALEAVLADVATSDLDAVYCLGDLVGYGPDPGGVVAKVRAARIPTLQGNHDDVSQVREREGWHGDGKTRTFGDGARSLAFTSARLRDAEKRWLSVLPTTLRFEAEGVRVLLTHGSPRSIDERLPPNASTDLLVALAGAAAADVICVGHVHVPYHRQVGHADDVAHFVSAGSVGMPLDGDPRACWVELTLDSTVAVQVHRCAYDFEAVAASVEAADLPPTMAEALRRRATLGHDSA